MASVNYPIGMNLGGDPSQALIHSNPDGKFTVALSAIDHGQGMKQVSRQIAAETLGVPVEDVYVDTADSDTGPHDMGSFASRGTHRMGKGASDLAFDHSFVQNCTAVMHGYIFVDTHLRCYRINFDTAEIKNKRMTQRRIDTVLFGRSLQFRRGPDGRFPHR